MALAKLFIRCSYSYVQFVQSRQTENPQPHRSATMGLEKFRSASVPHIRFDLPKKPFPHFTIHTRVLQFGWKHSGKFALLFSLLLTIAILVPYTVALLNGSIKPLLPLLSQESDKESHNGLFSIALFITAIVGSVMASVRYVHVSSQNEAMNWRLNVLNKLGLTSGFVSFAGLIVLASFRVSMPKTEEERLESSLFLPHVMGAFFAFFFGALYLLFQTSLSLFFYEGNARVVILRFTLFLLCAVCFAASILTIVPDNKRIRQSSNIYLQSEITAKPLKEPQKIRSVCEWLMVFFFASYFLTFVKESQKISVAITFRHLINGRRISIASLT